MKVNAIRVAVLAALSAVSVASLAQSQAARITNQTYGGYYADTSIELPLNGSSAYFNSTEYFLSEGDYTQSSAATPLPRAATFNVSGGGTSAYSTYVAPTVQMDGFAHSQMRVNHAGVTVSGFDPTQVSNTSILCVTGGTGACLPGIPEETRTITTTPNAYAYANSRWEDIYRFSGIGGPVTATYRLHIDNLGGTQGVAGAAPSGYSSFYWSEKDFTNTVKASVSASYYAESDSWNMSTFSNGAWTFENGQGSLNNITKLVSVTRSFAVTGTIYYDSYLQASVSGNGDANLRSTVELINLDLPTNTRFYAESGTSFAGVLSFAGGSGSGTVCTDLNCLAGPGGGGGGGGGGVTPVPEPESWALLLAGLGLLGAAIRRHNGKLQSVE